MIQSVSEPTSIESVPIGPGSGGLRMSPEEFDAIGQEEYVRGYRYELVDGVLVVNPIPGSWQSDPVDLLGWYLRTYERTHENGHHLDATMPEQYVYVANGRRLADRVVWAGLGRIPNPRQDPPTIAIEFVSGGKRDRVRDYETKRDEYRDAGVVEYWIIDRFDRTMTVHRYREEPVTRVVNEGETYATPLLPGFELPLAEVLAQADQWSDTDE